MKAKIDRWLKTLSVRANSELRRESERWKEHWREHWTHKINIERDRKKIRYEIKVRE